MRSSRQMSPSNVILGSVPPQNMPIIIKKPPPMLKLNPVPTKISMRLLTPRVMRLAKAEHKALRMIIPSPKGVNVNALIEPQLSMSMPKKPRIQPNILRGVSLSLGNTAQANNTRVKTLNELRIAARAPSL